MESEAECNLSQPSQAPLPQTRKTQGVGRRYREEVGAERERQT